MGDILSRLRDAYSENPASALTLLSELFQAQDEGKIIELGKESHQPMFVKSDALAIFDEWNDATGAIPRGISWYYEAQGVIEEIAAMAFGAGIFYESERKNSEKSKGRD
jgi:hypothetical protein